MKITESFVPSLGSVARLGLAGCALGLGVLSLQAQSSGSSGSSTTTRGNGTGTESTSSSERSARKASTMAKGMSRDDQKFIEKFGAANQREVALSQLALERATNPQVKAFAQKMVSDHSMAHREFMTVAAGGAIEAGASTLSSATASLNHSSGTTAPATTTTSGTRTSGSTVAGVTTRNVDATESTDSTSRESRTASATNPTGTNRAAATANDTSSTLSASSGEQASLSMTGRDAKQDRAYKKLMDKKGEDFDQAYIKAMVKEHEEAVELLEDVVEDKDDERNPQVRAFANKMLPNIRAHLSEAKQIEKQID
jgi:predicted outer membrane protein